MCVVKNSTSFLPNNSFLLNLVLSSDIRLFCPLTAVVENILKASKEPVIVNLDSKLDGNKSCLVN
jgi:hypothetical protein